MNSMRPSKDPSCTPTSPSQCPRKNIKFMKSTTTFYRGFGYEKTLTVV